MHDFYGTAHLLEDPESVFDAKVTVDLNKVTITSDNSEIGSWKHDDLDIRNVKGHVHLTADSETLVMKLEGQSFFLDLLGVDTQAEKGRRRRRKKQKTEVEFNDDERRPFSLADLKQQAAEDRADQIKRPLAIAMAAGAAAVLAGAALTWGPFRLLDPGGFPIARLLAGFGGLGGLLAVYLAYFDRNRFIGAAAAASAGVVTLCIAYLYAREARLGIGFIITVLGAQAMIAAGVMGVNRNASSRDVEDD